MLFSILVGHFCCCVCAFDFCSDSIAFCQALVEYLCCSGVFVSGSITLVLVYAEYFRCCSAFVFHPATPQHWGGYSGPWIALCFGHRCRLLFLVFPVAYSFSSGKVGGFDSYLGALEFSVSPVNIWGEGAEPRVS